jgi:hypothetical protein
MSAILRTKTQIQKEKAIMFRDAPSDILFHRQDIFSTIEAQKQAVTHAAEDVPEGRLRTESLDALADEVAANFQIEVPQLIEEEISVSPPREVEIELNRSQRFDYGFDGTRSVKGTSVTFTVPFKGDAEMFFVRPSSFTLNPPRGEVCGTALEHTVSGVTLDQGAVKSDFEGFLRSVKEYLGSQVKEVNSFNSSAKGLAYSTLQARKQRLQKGDDLVSGLGYKIK